VAEGASLAVDPAFHSQGIGEQLQIAGYRDMYARGIRVVRGETDRPETVRWLVARFGHRIVGTVPKRHAFGSPDVDQWTVLELDLDSLPELRKL
jgi:GNAT superfamily N-acetyltransferase